jgi:aryl-alcohol dehydrogenase-like predicted oxidoreductase
MEMVTLGRSGLKVSAICQGTWQLGGEWGAFDRDAAHATIRTARDLGINFFDTAQAYGFGESERVLGEALADELRTARDDVVIATKGGIRPERGGKTRDASPEWLRRGVDASLEALGTDVIDLYQLHWPDPDVPMDETAGALAELVESGKIRHVGVSNFDVAQMQTFAEYGPLETLQPPYDMFRRQIEDAILPWCQANGVGVLVYGPLAHGLLSGTMTPETTFADDDWRAHSSDFQGDTLRRNLAVVDALRTCADDLAVSLPVLAVAWALANPAVNVAIVGARSPVHLQETIGAVDLRLAPDVLAEIDGILAAAVPAHGSTPEGDPT